MHRPPERTFAQALWIECSVFFAGASLMAMEILAFRVIGKNFGTALRETSIVISVFLFAMSLGYWAGGRLADRAPTLRTFALVLVLAGLAILPVPLLDPMVSGSVYTSGLPLPFHSFLVAVALFGVPTLLLASVSPIAIRLLAPSREETGATAGTISAISTAGSITGSLLAAFVLIDVFQGVARSLTALAIVVVTSAVGTMILATTSASVPRARTVASGFTLATLSIAALGLLAHRTVAPHVVPGPDARQRTVLVRETPYHQIVVTDHDDRYRTMRFGRFAQSRMDLQDPDGPGFEYTDFFHLPLIFNPDGRRILFIGLGGGTGPKQFLRHYPDVEIVAIEVDPGVVDVAREYFGLPDDPRLTVAVADGRTWLRTTEERFDGVIVDAFTVNRYGISLPWQFTTLEFFRELEARLSPGGVVVYNSPAPAQTPISVALMRTMEPAFPYQLAFAAGRNTVIAASNENIGTTPAVLAGRVARLRTEGRVHLPGLEGRALQMVEHLRRAEVVPILTDDHAPVDELLRRSMDGDPVPSAE